MAIPESQSRLDLIRIEAEDRTALNGLLWQPQQASDSLVILVPGGTTGAALYPAHDYSPLASALTEKGYAFLLSNMRASYNNAYAEYGDAVADIAAFVTYGKSKGYTRIAILGISLGGPRMAQYMAERGDSAVKAVVFIASIPSPYLEFQVRSSEADKRRLEETLKHARELVAQGNGAQPVAYDDWFPGGVSVMGTAKALISFFGAPSDPSAPSSVKYGPQIKVPALVIHGDKDELALPPNAQKIYDSLTASPQRDLVWVKGASHYLTPGPLAKSYARQTTDWLVKNMPASPIDFIFQNDCWPAISPCGCRWRDGACVRPSRELADRLEASGNHIPASEIEAGMELHLPCLVKAGKNNSGYKTIEEFLPEAAE